MDPMTAMMLASMAGDAISKPIDNYRQKKQIKASVKANLLRLRKNDDTFTSNSYVNNIRKLENNKIEKEALLTESQTKEL